MWEVNNPFCGNFLHRTLERSLLFDVLMAALRFIAGVGRFHQEEGVSGEGRCGSS